VSEHPGDTAGVDDRQDTLWMRRALELAQRAGREGEVPVGAVLVRDGAIIGSGWNCPVGACDPTAHAEVMALRAAARAAGNYRLPGSTLYVTLEPCTMCVGAMVHARVQTLVFGAPEPRFGAVCSAARLLDEGRFNHRIDWRQGPLAAAGSALLQEFFRQRRQG